MCDTQLDLHKLLLKSGRGQAANFPNAPQPLRRVLFYHWWATHGNGGPYATTLEVEVVCETCQCHQVMFSMLPMNSS